MTLVLLKGYAYERTLTTLYFNCDGEPLSAVIDLFALFTKYFIKQFFFNQEGFDNNDIFPHLFETVLTLQDSISM